MGYLASQIWNVNNILPHFSAIIAKVTLARLKKSKKWLFLIANLCQKIRMKKLPKISSFLSLKIIIICTVIRTAYFPTISVPLFSYPI
jgi:hypothetical protein